ncbi:MAG: hypothetical protein H6740_17655 [Alphaproteobacteria bacterium]|nr:hypothetical protein [Alphaproteobacteria bacterium]
MLCILALAAAALAPAALADDPLPPDDPTEPGSPRGKLIQGTKIMPVAEDPEFEGPKFPSAPPANAEQREWVGTVIRQNYEGVRRCYIDGLLADDRMAGMLKVRIQLGPDGVPVWGEVALSSLESPRVEACMLAALKGMDYSRVDTHEVFFFGHTLVFFPEEYPSASEFKAARNLDYVEACYDQASAGHELRGVLQMEFVAREGRVVTPSFPLNTTENAELVDCVAASMPKWKVSRALSGTYTLLVRVTPEQGVTLYGLE